ncbi:MAG: adenosylmethionine--8-amino-7-oxononanoate transaminase [Candidatus Melainabacteria bacterium GWF2_37_15]|nr:MAG: adenosylmethionine--8-amino-7-oxononanoate transaminase [Candidatus Melainabacteria bacterium GWF2_37_15]
MHTDLTQKDLKYIWHPFTQMKDYETDAPPLIIDRGEGIYIWDIDGNKYIDGISSWWVNTLGHCHPRLNAALKRQIDKIEHVLLAGFSHVPVIELAEKLIQITPPELAKVFYSDNGSTAVEVALKMAYQYWQQSNQPQKTKFIALKNSYHGDTLGSVSVGGIDVYHKLYKPLLFDIYQAEMPYPDSIETILKEHHKEIAGLIVEPLVQAAAGMLMYPTEYLTQFRKLCDKYDVLLIDDEVAMGFGRTGQMFAFEHAGIVPDIICLAKGLTAGYLPLAVTITTEQIYQAFYDDYDKFKTFFHGHSFTGNPLAASVAVENLKIFEEEKIIESLQSKIQCLKKNLEKFRNLDYVEDIRHIGMIGAVEFKENIGKNIYKEALKRGAVLRPLGKVVYFMPPYVITEEEIDRLTDIAVDAIKAALG